MNPSPVDLGTDPSWWARVLKPGLNTLPLGLPADHAAAWMALVQLFQDPPDPDLISGYWDQAVQAGMPRAWLAEQALIDDHPAVVSLLHARFGPDWLDWKRSTLHHVLPTTHASTAAQQAHRALMGNLHSRNLDLVKRPTLVDLALQMSPMNPNTAVSRAIQGALAQGGSWAPRTDVALLEVDHRTRSPAHQLWFPLSIALATAHQGVFYLNCEEQQKRRDSGVPSPADLLMDELERTGDAATRNEALWALVAMACGTGFVSGPIQEDELAKVQRLLDQGADPNAPFPLEQHDERQGTTRTHSETAGRLLARAAALDRGWANAFWPLVAPFVRPESWQDLKGTPAPQVFLEGHGPLNEGALAMLARGSTEPFGAWYAHALTMADRDRDASMAWVRAHFGQPLPLKAAMDHVFHRGIKGLLRPPDADTYDRFEALSDFMAPHDRAAFLGHMAALRNAPQSVDNPGWHTAVAAFRLGAQISPAPAATRRPRL